jgi:hypothetical protein
MKCDEAPNHGRTTGASKLFNHLQELLVLLEHVLRSVLKSVLAS